MRHEILQLLILLINFNVIATSAGYCIISYGLAMLFSEYTAETKDYLYMFFYGLPDALNKTRQFIKDNLTGNIKQIDYRIVDRNVMIAKAQVEYFNNQKVIEQIIEATELNADISAYAKIPSKVAEAKTHLPITIKVWITITCIYIIYRTIEDTILHNKYTIRQIVQAFIISIASSLSLMLFLIKLLNYDSKKIDVRTIALYTKIITSVFLIHLLTKLILSIIKWH